MLDALSFFLRAAGDIILPRACIVCGTQLGLQERHLCLSCAADVPYTYFWLQPHNPMADRFNAVLERHRGTERMDYAYAVALMHYKGDYRQIPRSLKYHGNLAAGRYFGALLGRHIASAPHFADVDLILPVPLHRTRRRARGYNQAEVLARAITLTLNSFRTPSPPDGRSEPATTTDERTVLKSGGIPDHLPSVTLDPPPSVSPCPTPPVSPGLASSVIPGLTGNLPFAECRTDLLVRARRTRTQTRVSVEQKAQNVASAFRVPDRTTLSLFNRWPIGVGHDESLRFWRDLFRLSMPDNNRYSRCNFFRHFLRDVFFHSQCDVFRHSRLDRESDPRKVLASARHILLVDDTYTTGATLYACYAALRPFTSARISIATLAAVEGTPSDGP